jgi:hypothetical protein
MTVDERDKWLQELSLHADKAELEGRNAESEAKSELDVGPGAEDFSEDSG